MMTHGGTGCPAGVAVSAPDYRSHAGLEAREQASGSFLEVGGAEIGRLVFQPGWRWSNDLKP